MRFSFFFFNDTATTEIYTLSLHDALPISSRITSTSFAQYSFFAAFSSSRSAAIRSASFCAAAGSPLRAAAQKDRSEEHTSELQSQSNLVCRLLLEKKKILNQSSHMERYAA